MRHHPSRRQGSPTRRFEIRYRCASAAVCRCCRNSNGHHVSNYTGDVERGKRAVMYLQRLGRVSYIWDTWTSRRVEFRGYEPGIWRVGSMEAWGDSRYEAVAALREAQGTWSLMVHDRRGYRVLARDLPPVFLWPIRESLAGLVEGEDPVAFCRWAVKQLRATTLEQVALLGIKLCSVVDWPGAIPLEQLVSPAAA